MANSAILVNGITGVRNGLSKFSQAATHIASAAGDGPENVRKEVRHGPDQTTEISKRLSKTANQTVGSLLDVFA